MKSNRGAVMARMLDDLEQLTDEDANKVVGALVIFYPNSVEEVLEEEEEEPSPAPPPSPPKRTSTKRTRGEGASSVVWLYLKRAKAPQQLGTIASAIAWPKRKARYHLRQLIERGRVQMTGTRASALYSIA